MRWDATEKPRIPRCPQCGTALQHPAPEGPGRHAGDFICKRCPPNRPRLRLRLCYWWRREVFPVEETYTL